MRDSERWFCVAYGIWLLGVFAYFVPAATWNPVSRFDLTRAIVEHRTLSIGELAENTGDRSLVDGKWYTDKAPIPSMLAVPVYGLFYAGQGLRGARPEYSVVSTPRVPALHVSVNGTFQRGLYVCSLSTAGACTAVLGVLLFLLLSRRFSSKVALIASAGTVLGTPLLPYATSFYGHGVAAMFLVAALFALFAVPSAVPAPPRIRIAGACLALGAGSEYLVAVPALVIVLALLAFVPRPNAPRALLDLVAGALLPTLIVAGYHQACFGAPWRTGYSFLVRPEFVKGHAAGLMGLHLPTLSALGGLLLGRSRGLFFLSPAAGLALVFGVTRALRDRDLASRTSLAAFVALLLANAGYYMWWGGAAAGPRHLVPVIGLLSFGLAAALESRAWAVAVALLAASVANLLVLTGVGLEAPDQGDALFDYAYREFAQGRLAALSGASNLGIRLGLARGATLGPVVVWILLGGRFLLRRVEPWTSPAIGDAELTAADQPTGAP